MITDIIFDFYGTLVDYAENWESSGTNTSYEYLCALGFKMEKQEFTKKFDDSFADLTAKATTSKTEFHMYDLGKYFFKQHFDHTIDDMENRIFIDKSINDWNKHVVFFDGIHEFIGNLSQNYRLSILSNTNYPDLIHRNLIKMSLNGYFYEVYTSVEIGIKKPNREIFEFVLNDLGIKSRNSLFVGDNYNDDYLGAKTVHMNCYLIDTRKRFPDSIPTKINTVFELADRIAW
jgi:putative hydrolase of the HAD superfamily